MQLPRAYQMEQVSQYDVTNTAVPIPINNRVFMIVNQGGQPLYIDPKNTATADSFMIPAGMAWPQFMSCDGELSVISNATGTSVGILYLDV